MPLTVTDVLRGEASPARAVCVAGGRVFASHRVVPLHRLPRGRWGCSTATATAPPTDEAAVPRLLLPADGSEEEDEEEEEDATPYGVRAFLPRADGEASRYEAFGEAVRDLVGGHSRPVSAVAVSPAGDVLATCSADAVVFWDLAEALEAARPCGRTLPLAREGDAPEEAVAGCAWDASGRVLAVARGAAARVLRADTGACLATLEGHAAAVTAVAFGPRAVVLTASEDRTFRVWDLGEARMLFDSGVVSAAPLTAVAADHGAARYAAGDACGVVRLYDAGLVGSTGSCRLYATVDAAAAVAAAAAPPPAQPQAAVAAAAGGSNDEKDPIARLMKRPAVVMRSHRPAGEGGTAAQRMMAALEAEHAPRDAAADGGGDGAAEQSCGVLSLGFAGGTLVVVTALGVVSVNPMTAAVEGALAAPGVSAAAACGDADGYASVALAAAFNPAVTVVRVPLAGDAAPPASSAGEGWDAAAAAAPPLRREGPPREGGPLARWTLDATKRAKGGGKGKGGGVRSQPVVFRRGVRSSGYGARPTSDAARGRWKGKKPAAPRPRKPAAAVEPSPMGPAPTRLDGPRGGPKHHQAAVTGVAFAGDGSRLLTWSVDGTARVDRAPLCNRPRVLAGHDAPVRCAAVSARAGGRFGPGGAGGPGLLALTGSSDRTARLWRADRSDPVLVFRGSRSGSGGVACAEAAAAAPPGETASRHGPPLEGDVVAASFFCRDRFVMLASGASVRLFRYHLDDAREAGRDLVRMHARNRYRVALAHTDESAHAVTAASCANAYDSNLVLYAASDRSLSVLDADAGRVVWRVPDAHARPAHSLRLAGDRGFLTAAADGAALLWDARTCRPVRRFSSHVNKVQPVGASASPCGRFVGTGSEDKLCYVYSVADGTLVSRLAGHTGVVSDAAWDPARPGRLVSAGYDGSVRFWS